MDANPLEPALDKMSVAPGPDSGKPLVRPADAGTDTSIAERLARNPESKEARLDRALDESMDASDPPASTQPVHNLQPPESSGYDPRAEQRLAQGEPKGLVGRVLAKLGLS
jgi:hypothetical protein